MVRLLSRCLPINCIPRKKRQSFPIGEQQINGTKHQEKINKLFVRRVESIRVTHQAAVVKRLPIHTINERHHLEHKKPKQKSPRHHHHHQNEKLIKPDDTEFDCETHISDPESKQKIRKKSKKKSSSIKQLKANEKAPSPSRTQLQKLFNKTKKISTPSPKPPKVIDKPNKEEEDDDDDTASTISSSTTSSISSDWSTTTYPDSESSDKSNIPIQRRQSMPVTNQTNDNHELKHRSCLENFYFGKEQAQSSLSPSHTKKTLSKVKDSQQQQQQQNRRNDIKPSAKSKQVLQNVQKMIKDQNIQEQHFNDKQKRESVRL